MPSSRIPATNLKVRGALLEDAPRLLDGLPKYGKFLEAVQNERKRKGLDESPTPIGSEDLEDANLPKRQIDEYREMVAMFTQNMRVLILGGTPRPRVPDELKGLLNCAEVEWAESTKGDRASKFRAQINRSDIVIAAKNLASHEITEKARQWTEEVGEILRAPTERVWREADHPPDLQAVDRTAGCVIEDRGTGPRMVAFACGTKPTAYPHARCTAPSERRET